MSKITYKFYDFLSGDDELRACESIPDKDCTNVARNFMLNIANGSLTKLAEKIISPNLTLPWIFGFLGAPAFMTGMLVPVKDAGSLLPQLFVSAKIRSFQRRKYFWVTAALIQAVVMALGAGVLYWFPGQAAAWILLGIVALFSIASGVASVSFKDVTGKTIPKGERGRMLGYRATFGGILAVSAGVFLIIVLREDLNRSIYAGMFLLASFLWAAAALLFALIVEKKGSVEGGRTPAKEFLKAVGIVKKDTNFRNFLFTRALLMAVPLLQPFYVLMAKDMPGKGGIMVAAMVMVSGLAAVLSSPFWGKLADKNSVVLMRIASGLALSGIVYAVVFLYAGDKLNNFYAFLPVFFLNGIAYAGARLSRKTYLVDYAPAEERPVYVSVANTVIGIFTLIAAGFGFVAEWFGLGGQFIFFGIMLVGVIALSFRLKEI